MAFYFEDDSPTVAKVHKAGIFLTGGHEHPAACARQGLEPFNRILVAAVLAPHAAESAELGEVWCPPKFLFYQFKFFFS